MSYGATLRDLWQHCKSFIVKTPAQNLSPIDDNLPDHLCDEEKASWMTDEAMHQQSLMHTILNDELCHSVNYWGLFAPTLIKPEKPSFADCEELLLPLPVRPLQTLTPEEMPSFAKQPLLKSWMHKK